MRFACSFISVILSYDQPFLHNFTQVYVLPVIQSLRGTNMQSSRLRARYRYIMAFFARAVVGFIYWEIVLPRIGLRSLSRRTRSKRYRQLAARFRMMAIRMG